MGVGHQKATARGGKPGWASGCGHAGAHTSPDCRPLGPGGYSHDVSALRAAGQGLLRGGRSLHHCGCGWQGPCCASAGGPG
eukprot:13037995-Alexandrium_andersonii.AAC.1